jgi:DNA-binding CsgD family transcriptional regulator
MATAAAAPVGREAELAAIADFLEAETAACAVAIEGEAGIGKTTVWEAAVSGAAGGGFRVLRARPAESEAKLAFSSLADLLGDASAEVLDDLPPPQRRALEVALLIDDGEGGRGADRRAVAAGLLSSLRKLAAGGRVLLAIDDVHWLDPSSAAALDFAVRRLRDEAVALLLARRLDEPAGDRVLEDALPAENCLRVTIESLDFLALNTLLRERLAVVLSRPILHRIHELSRGNPFFALELARAPARLEAGTLPPTLDALVRGRLAALPDKTRAALLVASAASHSTVELVARVVGEPDALAAAEAARIVELDHGRVRFTHPLLASAVYTATAPAQRRETHAKLAGLVRDPERRAVHLAAAATGPDEKVAEALELGATRARARGAPAAAAELSEEAAQLTPADRGEDALRRLARAGYYHFESGDSRRALVLLEQVVVQLPAGPERADVLTRLAGVRSYSDDLQAAANLFLQAAEEAGDERALKARALEGAAAQLFRQRRRLDEAVEHAKGSAALARELEDDALLALALGSQFVAEATLGRPEAAATLDAALALQPQVEHERILNQPECAAAAAATWWEEPGSARRAYAKLIKRAQAAGDEASLAYVYVLLAQADCLLGDFERGRRNADAAREIAEQAWQQALVGYGLAVRALSDAHRGREQETREAAELALELGRATQFTPVSQVAGAALGLLELSLGHAEEAAQQLGRLVDFAQVERICEPGLTRYASDQVEALIELGRLEDAADLLDWHEGNAERLGRRGALAACLRCRGLLAAAQGRLDDSLAAFEQALAGHGAVALPFDRARTLLAFGAALRRAKRKADARERLEEAVAAFVELGAATFAERARAELGRVSGRRRSEGGLTPTERQVAELVADGRSNKEVAAALFVTVKTVEANLSRVYAKLGLRSRAELARQLAEREPAAKQ